ncbi:MAG: DUF2513 domain-containing protein [Planctomycetes bacterium]|nr:DUF2513 domain-containing protein [Planctomycetota bacterium]
MELVRRILLAVEGSPGGFAPREIQLEGYSTRQIAYHAHLMIEAGLIEGIDTTHPGSDGPEAIPRSLTWAGHEFLDAARDDRRWKKAMETARSHATAVTFDVLKSILVALARDAIPVLSSALRGT